MGGIAIFSLGRQTAPGSVTTNGQIMFKDTIPVVRVQLEQTEFSDMEILYIHDSAQSTAAITEIFRKDFGELMLYLKANKLMPRKFLAWYYTGQPPWSIDIAVEPNGEAGPLTRRIQSRVQPGGEVIIAHMWGPYDRVGQAYRQVADWLKENHRKPLGAPFEVYLNDPSLVKEASEIRTDIYQLIQ
ncbi:MAG TPA: GyrI-like domain-containing protein [Chitinophagaceae bacterium]|nr:GyrI-like domain-containing protein [Chitinophagaceae bacterium]